VYATACTLEEKIAVSSKRDDVAELDSDTVDISALLN